MTTRRLSVTLDPELLDEAVRASGADSKREAIEEALRVLVRRRRIERMAERAGAVDLTRSVDDLIADREAE